MSQKQRKGFDYTTVLLLIVVAASFLGIFSNPIEQADFDRDEAGSPVEIYFHNVRPECAVTGISPDYTGEFLVIEREYEKNGKKYELVGLYSGFLAGTDIRHVRMARLPENIEPDAFAGARGVVVYTDQTITGDMEWTEYVTIEPLEAFDELVNPGASFEFNLSSEQLINFVKSWAGDEKVMLRTTVPLAVVMFLLCFLRQKSGRGNPLWPIFRSGIGKWLFMVFSFIVGLFTALVLFCEEADVGLDLYGIVEFMLGWPLYVLAAIAVLFLIGDLFRRDFPWFIARWVIRAAIMVLIIMFCAIVGWVAATIVTENLGLFKTLYILGLIFFVSLIFGGGGKVNDGLKMRMQSSTVIAENGSSMRVDYYSHGTYVGGDPIVGFGSDTLTGASGSVYKKY